MFRGTCDGVEAAIKVFGAGIDTRRIDREIDLLSELKCPYVVRLLRHFTGMLGTEPVRILAYELHGGGDLTRHLAPGAAPLSSSDLLRIGRHVAEAISTLWSKRIVHRDIKPANIVCAADGRYMLVDVGFARHLDRSDITLAGAPGTVGFRSPEQARGRKSLTIHSDVFALGVTLFTLACRSHPFGGRDPLLPQPADMTPLLSRSDLRCEFSKLVQEMLSFAPASRPTDIASRFAALGEP